jgi:hypothetical protein
MTNIKRNFETPSGLLAQIEQRCASSRFAAPRCFGLRAVVAVIRRARCDRTPWREVRNQFSVPYE